MSDLACAPRRKIVAVFGYAEGSLSKIRKEDSETHARLVAQALELGAWLAEQDVHILTGGGGGIMAAASQGFYEAGNRRGGLVLGILPGPEPREGYPNKWVEVPIRTHLPGNDPMAKTYRNHINALTADVLIALPGGEGTLAELQLAHQYGKTVAVFIEGAGDTIGSLNQQELSAKYRVITSKQGIEHFVLERLAK